MQGRAERGEEGSAEASAGFSERELSRLESQVPEIPTDTRRGPRGASETVFFFAPSQPGLWSPRAVGALETE